MCVILHICGSVCGMCVDGGFFLSVRRRGGGLFDWMMAVSMCHLFELRGFCTRQLSCFAALCI